MRLILPRRAVLAAPALVLPHRRANAQMMQGILSGQSVAPGPFWTLIASTSVIADSGGAAGAVTTPAIDTTGANLLVVGTGNNPGSASSSVSDSKSNVWTKPLGSTGGTTSYVGSLPAVVGSGHTFTLTTTGTFVDGSLIVYAFKSASGTPFIDTNGGNGYGASLTVTSGNTVSLNPSTITPSGSNRLVWSVLGEFNGSNNTYSVNAGLAIPIQIPGTYPNAFGLAVGWAISSSAVAVVWTTTNAIANTTASQAIFMGSV